MPVQTHTVRMVFLVLYLGMFALQNGCSNSGSGQAEAPATDSAAALRLDLTTQTSLTTATGTPAIVADGRSTVPVRITVANGAGTPMSGVAVTFATTDGTFSTSPVVRVAQNLSTGAISQAATGGSISVSTDANGIAQVLLTASTSVGLTTVTADVQGFRTHIDIFFAPGPPAHVQLNASPNAMNAGGTSTFTATVTDANGNPVPGETITFTFSTNTSGASLSATNGMTDSKGQATVGYTAGTTAGADTVRALATSTSVAGSTSITVTAPPPSTGGPVPSHIDLLVSSPQLYSNGLEAATLTALVRDASNNVLSGIAVNFAASSGGIQVTSGTTTVTGTATALLTTGGDPTNRTITVTATAGTLSSTNTVQVSGTTLSVSGASTLVLGVTTPLSIILRDSGGVGIPNQSITVSSAIGNSLSTPTVTTDTTGQATVAVTARVPGNDTIHVSALGAAATATLTISAANFVFTTPASATQVLLNTPQAVTVHWDEAGVNQVGQLINFFSTRGNFTATSTCPATIGSTISATTDANGNATVNICADNAGPAVVSAASNVSSGPSGQVAIEFVATTPAALVLQATLTTLGVNPLGSKTQQSIITAVVRDAQGNLVTNRTVSFSLQDVSGGQIFPASAVTDSFGSASTVYTAGAAPSAKDGVLLTAVVDCPASPPPTCPPPPATVTLTVAQQPLFVTLGTGNLISAPSSTQYSQPYSVLVTDANGNPVVNATVALNVLPTRYEKGLYVLAFNSATNSCIGWTKLLTVQGATDPDDVDQACDSEDTNRNGVLDAGEDRNNNGRLDSGNVASVPSTVTTNASGFALFDIVYAKEFTWVEVELEARTVVAGSEGASRVRFFLRGLVSDFNNCSVAPPGQVSPYGVATTCSCDEQTNPICPAGFSPVTVTPVNTPLLLPSNGGTFTFAVSGGTQSAYDLTTTSGTLSIQRVVFGQPFGLMVGTNATGQPVTITLTAKDVTTGQVGILTLTQSP